MRKLIILGTFCFRPHVWRSSRFLFPLRAQRRSIVAIFLSSLPLVSVRFHNRGRKWVEQATSLFRSATCRPERATQDGFRHRATHSPTDGLHFPGTSIR